MAGRKENLKPMWAELRKFLDLEPEVPSCNNTYLGCSQRPVSVAENLIKEKADLFMRLLTPKSGNAIGEVEDNSVKLQDVKS